MMGAVEHADAPTRRQRLYDLLDAAYAIRAWISLWDDHIGSLASDVSAWFDARCSSDVDMTITMVNLRTESGRTVREIRIRRGHEPFVEVYSLPKRPVTS